MLNGLIKLMSIFMGVFTLIFIALPYAKEQGFDRSTYFQAVNHEVSTSSTTLQQVQTEVKNTISTTSIKFPVVASSSKVKGIEGNSTTTPTHKSSPPSIKKSDRIKPVITAPAPLLVEREVTQVITSTTLEQATTSNELGLPDTMGALNQKAILELVNNERAKIGLAALSFNIRLSAMAEGKAVDMINKQYFAHVSPTGVDVSNLSDTYHYEYIYLGENLALGDFISSADVMNGWMNSPGHRANILNSNYTEIGISALQGNYQGRTVWYAVQEFGRPLSSCPSPDSTLETKISKEEAQVSQTELILTSQRAQIEQLINNQDSYNLAVEKFNSMVDDYNTLVANTKKDIITFNSQVSAFNNCIGTPPH